MNGHRLLWHQQRQGTNVFGPFIVYNNESNLVCPHRPFIAPVVRRDVEKS
jgi:hypothetical protein